MKRLLPIKENQTSLVNDIVLFLCMGRYRFWVHWNHCFDKHPLVAQMVKHLSAVQKVWVWSLGWEDPLEEEMATHSSIPAWRIPWTEEPDRLQSIGLKRAGQDWKDLVCTQLTVCRLSTDYLAWMTCYFHYVFWYPQRLGSGNDRVLLIQFILHHMCYF